MYTAVYYTDRQVLHFSTGSLQEAHQYLRDHSQLHVWRHEQIAAIVAGANDEIIYFNHSYTICEKLLAIVRYFSGLYRGF